VSAKIAINLTQLILSNVFQYLLANMYLTVAISHTTLNAAIASHVPHPLLKQNSSEPRKTSAFAWKRHVKILCQISEAWGMKPKNLNKKREWTVPASSLVVCAEADIVCQWYACCLYGLLAYKFFIFCGAKWNTVPQLAASMAPDILLKLYCLFY